MTTITAVGSAQRFEFFTVDRDTAIATRTRAGMKGNSVNKCGH